MKTSMIISNIKVLKFSTIVMNKEQKINRMIN